MRDGWPDKEIHLFGPGVDSGTFDYFTEAIMGKADVSRGDYTSSEDDNVIVQGIGGDEFALGYFGFAYYEENQGKLKLVAVDDGNDANGKGPILPSPQTVKDGTYFPLSRPIFIYPKVKALDRPEVKAFVEFYLNAGSATRPRGWLHRTERRRVWPGADAFCCTKDGLDVSRHRQSQRDDARAAPRAVAAPS